MDFTKQVNELIRSNNFEMVFRRHFAYAPVMSDDADPDQRRDALLLRLLKTPPQPRPKREVDKSKPVTGKRLSKRGAPKWFLRPLTRSTQPGLDVPLSTEADDLHRLSPEKDGQHRAGDPRSSRRRSSAPTS